MSHISYSELKDWSFCAWYHKLTRVDKIDGFKGNEYTAFGTAMHSVCEKKLLQEEVDEEFFVQELKKNISDLDEDLEINKKLVVDMMDQGKNIIPEIEDALNEYFEEYEVMAVEMPLMEKFIFLIGKLVLGAGMHKSAQIEWSRINLLYIKSTFVRRWT